MSFFLIPGVQEIRCRQETTGFGQNEGKIRTQYSRNSVAKEIVSDTCVCFIIGMNVGLCE